MTAAATASIENPFPCPSAKDHHASNWARSLAVARSVISVTSVPAVVSVQSAPTKTTAQAEIVLPVLVIRERLTSTRTAATAETGESGRCGPVDGRPPRRRLADVRHLHLKVGVKRSMKT
jgi:hypothetical protein